MTYPIVKTPRLYNNLAIITPNIVKPSFPESPVRVREHVYDKFKKDYSFTIFSFIAPLILILTLSALLLGYAINVFFIVISTICFLGLLLAGSSMYDVISYYLGALLSYKTKSKEIENYYQMEIIKYQGKLLDYNKLVEDVKNPDFVHNYRLSRLPENLLFFCKKPVVHPYGSKFKKGVSENYVLSILKDKFSNIVFVNQTVTGEHQDPFKSFEVNFSGLSSAKPIVKNEVERYTPMPDFILYDSNIGYVVVIEIDEPYDLEFGNPIHCIGNDNSRDDYFLKYNWPILRFAEQQFLTNPIECCDFIANYINSITLGLSKLEVLNKNKTLSSIKCWTEDEAINMEKNGFRETYLPSNMVGDGLHAIIYKNNGPAIRQSRRERAIAEDIEREERRVAQLKLETELRNRYRYLDNEENDLPF